MPNSNLEQQLDHLERQCEVVASALIGTDPAEVQTSSLALQQMAVNFTQMLGEPGHNGLALAHQRVRLKALAQSMQTLRATLLRRMAYVEQALQLVIPATQKTTYAAPALGKTSRSYGQGGRPSGMFNGFSA